MDFKALACVYIFMLLVSSMSIGILAAPVVAVSPSSSPQNSTARNSLTSPPNPKRTNSSLAAAPISNVHLAHQSSAAIDKTEKCNSGGVKCARDFKEYPLLKLYRKGREIGSGSLGNKIGQGSFGKVYRLPYGWSGTRRAVVAKQFMDNTDGDIEIDNLEAVNEIADWGYDRNRGLWAIVNKGDGVKLRQLPSFQNRVISMRRGIEGCREYMGLIRDGIVEESTKYFEMRGAPMHGDLHQGNVLMKEEYIRVTGLPTLQLNVRLIDWSSIVWRLTDHRDKATDSQVKRFKQDLKTQLRKGWVFKGRLRVNEKDFDFSDHNNCYRR